MIEFLIYDHREENGRLFVSGIVNVGTVRIGTTFRFAKAPDNELSAIFLTVHEIACYGHTLTELSRRVTGGLYVEGEGQAALAHDVTLATNAS